MNSVSKMESENTYSIKVIVRLRGYSQPIVKIKNKSLPESSNIPNKPNTNKYTTIPSPTLYHIFTSANKCNKVILTKEGLKQQLIMAPILSMLSMEALLRRVTIEEPIRPTIFSQLRVKTVRIRQDILS